MTDETMASWVGVVTDSGSVRPNNEDAYAVRLDVGLFAVADGMGGHRAGEVAAGLAVQCVQTAAFDPLDPEGSLVTIVEGANALILQDASVHPHRAGMGTTLTVAHVGERELTIAHVGDSRAYLFKGGRIRQLTRDHSVVGELVSTGQIDNDEARRHPQRHMLTQALGTQEKVGVEVVRVDRAEGEFLLLCTDGLTEVVPDEDIASVIEDAGCVQDAVRLLVETAKARGGPDNVTVILIDLRADMTTPGPTF